MAISRIVHTQVFRNGRRTLWEEDIRLSRTRLFVFDYLLLVTGGSFSEVAHLCKLYPDAKILSLLKKSHQEKIKYFWRKLFKWITLDLFTLNWNPLRSRLSTLALLLFSTIAHKENPRYLMHGILFCRTKIWQNFSKSMRTAGKWKLVMHSQIRCPQKIMFS